MVPRSTPTWRPSSRLAPRSDGMAAPDDAAGSPQQAIGHGEAAPASLAALFAEAAASAEGGVAEVLRAYEEARGRFGAAQRDAATRTRLQQACVPAGPLLDTLMAHLDSANLSLCAVPACPVCCAYACVNVLRKYQQQTACIATFASIYEHLAIGRPYSKVGCMANHQLGNDNGAERPVLPTTQEPRRRGAQRVAAR